MEVTGASLSLSGTVLGARDDDVVRVEYAVVTDEDGLTVEVHVTMHLRGSRLRSTVLTRDVEGRWTVDGVLVPALDGCTDVDLGCTPSTNALPIRRLRLAPGESRTIQAAWVAFPRLMVVRTSQTYTRVGASRYRYASGAYESELTVDDEGFVMEYDEWRRTGTGPGLRVSGSDARRAMR